MRKISTLAAVTFFALVNLSPAHSHSSVAETKPQYKSTVTALPEDVSITFSEKPLNIAGKTINTITVTNPDDIVISYSKTEISGSTLTVRLSNAKKIDGTYSVRYRMASADGHVIAGNYEFYLNQPSSEKSDPVTTSEESGLGHFFHIHKGHILYSLAVLLLALGVLQWRRRAHSR
jgi:methionine-rich copper-binding protein CopC